MRTERYEAQILKEMDWWLELLEQEGRDRLRQSATELGLAGMRDFVRANAGALQPLPGSTMQARQLLVQRQTDPVTLHALLLAAFWQVHCAHYWHQQAQAYVDAIRLTKPDRHVIPAAVRACREFLRDYPSFWPFQDGTDPFGEGLPIDDDADED